MILRPYQTQAIAEARALIASGCRRFLFQCPTGGGKTIIALYIIAQALARGKRILFQAHRKELIKQPYRKMVDEYGFDSSLVSLIYGGSKLRNPDAPIQLSSAQSLHLDNLPEADLVFNDECHRAPGNKQRQILEYYAKHSPKTICIGLTATPERLDGRGLGDIYDAIITVAKPSELVALGAILDPTIYTVSDDQLPDLKGVGQDKGDYDGTELGNRVNKAVLISSIVENWLKHARADSYDDSSNIYKRTICFAVNRTHSKAIVEAFKAAGVRAAHIDATTPTNERQQAQDDLRDGKLDVLSQCELLIEGVDIPPVKCVILARPTQSITMLLQSIGRAVRPWPSINESERAVVLDHAGNIIYHGLPMEDRVYSLSGRIKKGSLGRDAVTVKTCPNCYFLCKLSALTCGGCPYVFSPGSCKAPLSKEGMLEEAKKERIESKKKEHWQVLTERARLHGYTHHWMVEEFMKRWRVPCEYMLPDLAPTAETKTKVLRMLTNKQVYAKLPWSFVEREYKKRFGESVPARKQW